MCTLSEFIGFPVELSMEKSKETEVTVLEQDEEENEEEGTEGWLVALSPCRKTPWSTRGGQVRHEVHFRLEEDQSEFLEERRLGDLVVFLSEFIGFPTELHVEKSKVREVTDSEEVEEKF